MKRLIDWDGRTYDLDTMNLRRMVDAEAALGKPYTQWNYAEEMRDFLTVLAIVLAEDHDDAGIEAIISEATLGDMTAAIRYEFTDDERQLLEADADPLAPGQPPSSNTPKRASSNGEPPPTSSSTAPGETSA